MDARWLRALGEERLAGLLTRRPEAATPVPASLAELASRLIDPMTVLAALRRLVLPSVQVAEAIAALRSRTERPALDRLLGAVEPAAVAAVDRALADLTEHGLLITDGDTLTLVPTVRYAWDSPLGLGPPVDGFLNGMALGELRVICVALGLTPRGNKADAVASVVTALCDAHRLQSIVATAPPAIRQMLERIAASGELVMVQQQGYGPSRPGGNESTMQWLIDRGLLLPTGPWGNEFVMPAEVALSLRGPGYTAPFEPQEPFCPRTPAEPAAVARDASAAAGSFLRLAVRVMDEASRGRVPTVRTGGVGIRELRRLAKACDTDVNDVRLVLAVLHRAGLLAMLGDGAAPTDSYDTWLADQPADRLAALIQAWWSLSYSPLATEGAWTPSELDNGTQELRAGALRLLAAAPGAPRDPVSFVEQMNWRHPYLLRAVHSELTAVVAAWRTEATKLGVLGAGAVSEAGLALLADDHSLVVAALAGVGQSVMTAHLQADLTAVVAGTPAPAIADLLAAVADRESTGAASTWRFSPDSIRRALDTGWTADAVLEELGAIATNGVPQALTYLIRDVERRHGVIRLSAVVCCLRSADTSLLAEVAADRRLRGLGLRLLAPTVLAGTKPLPETLTALRKAGYAPVEESADGTAVIETATRRRTVVSPRARPEPMRALATARRRAVAVAGADGSEDVRALVRTLLDRTDGVVPVNRPAPVFMNLLGSDFDDPDDVEDYPFGGSYPPPRYPRMPWRRRY